MFITSSIFTFLFLLAHHTKVNVASQWLEENLAGPPTPFSSSNPNAFPSNHISRSHQVRYNSPTLVRTTKTLAKTALCYFEKKNMAERNTHLPIDEDKPWEPWDKPWENHTSVKRWRDPVTKRYVWPKFHVRW